MTFSSPGAACQHHEAPWLTCVCRTQTDAVTNSIIMRQFYSHMLSLRTLPVPVIAAINGSRAGHGRSAHIRSPAVGAGLCLAAACDIRIAGTNAKLGWTFAALGLHPGMAATQCVHPPCLTTLTRRSFTAQLIGPQLAAKLLLTGEVCGAVPRRRWHVAGDSRRRGRAHRAGGRVCPRRRGACPGRRARVRHRAQQSGLAISGNTVRLV